MSGASRKLLFLVTEDWYFVSHRLPIARAARDAGFDVAVAARFDEHEHLIRREGFQLIPLRTLQRKSRQPLREAATIAELTAIYRREKPDIVHHVAIKPVLYGSIAAKLARVPAVVNAIAGLGFVFISGENKFSPLKEGVKLLYRAALLGPNTVTIFQNPDDRDQFVGSGLVAHDQTVLIRGSGVDITRFCSNDGLEGKPRIVFGARMLRDKGVGELAEAARILEQRQVDCEILLFGNPDPENPATVTKDELAKFCECSLLEWRGYTDDMAKTLMESHIACLPSYREGLPKFLLEAAACGLPIVATDVPGCREIVRDGESGFLVPARSAKPLADALQRLVERPRLRHEMGQRGRRMVEDELSEEAVVRQTLALYEEVLV